MSFKVKLFHIKQNSCLVQEGALKMHLITALLNEAAVWASRYPSAFKTAQGYRRLLMF